MNDICRSSLSDRCVVIISRRVSSQKYHAQATVLPSTDIAVRRTIERTPCTDTAKVKINDIPNAIFIDLTFYSMMGYEVR